MLRLIKIDETDDTHRYLNEELIEETYINGEEFVLIYGKNSNEIDITKECYNRIVKRYSKSLDFEPKERVRG